MASKPGAWKEEAKDSENYGNVLHIAGICDMVLCGSMCHRCCSIVAAQCTNHMGCVGLKHG
jgi:hypothetical protein